MTTAPLRGPGLAAGTGRGIGPIPRWLVHLGLAVVGLLLLQWLFRATETFPERWYIHLADPITDVQTWIRDNRTDHWLFTSIITPSWSGYLAAAAAAVSPPAQRVANESRTSSTRAMRSSTSARTATIGAMTRSVADVSAAAINPALICAANRARRSARPGSMASR